jgi:hypothetical protein
MLVTTVPPPLNYDSYNRLFTLAPLLVLFFWAWARPHVAQGGRGGKAGWWIVLIGLIVQLTGNVIEFWGVLLQDRPAARTAYEEGVQPWIGSEIGFMVFILGALLIAVGSILVGRAIRRSRAGRSWVAAPLAGLAGVPWGIFVFPLVTGAAWAWLAASLRPEQ